MTAPADIVPPNPKERTMAATNGRKHRKAATPDHTDAGAFKLREGGKREIDARVHLLAPGIVCDTEPRGYARPQNRSPMEIVVDASEGFIPLWSPNVTLRWRFRDRSMSRFANPAAAKTGIRKLLGDALLAWGTAAPVRFKEDPDVWDFEIVMRRGDDCSASGCVLASAFFPDAGRHRLTLFPKLFEQDRKEQVETLIHEIGHVFGLRHFFANVSETAWPSEIFGTHSKFSIMNYGTLSTLTPADKSDLTRLYQMVWSGALTHINGTTIRLVKPFNSLASVTNGVVAAAAQVGAPVQPQPRVALIGI
jgi:hypothetical protein